MEMRDRASTLDWDERIKFVSEDDFDASETKEDACSHGETQEDELEAQRLPMKRQLGLRGSLRVPRMPMEAFLKLLHHGPSTKLDDHDFHARYGYGWVRSISHSRSMLSRRSPCRASATWRSSSRLANE